MIKRHLTKKKIELDIKGKCIFPNDTIVLYKLCRVKLVILIFIPQKTQLSCINYVGLN